MEEPSHQEDDNFCPFLPLHYKLHFHLPEIIPQQSKSLSLSGHLKLLLKYKHQTKNAAQKEIVKCITGLKCDPQTISIHSTRIHVKSESIQSDFLAIPLKQQKNAQATETNENPSSKIVKSDKSKQINSTISHDLALELDEENLILELQKKFPNSSNFGDITHEISNRGFFSKSDTAMLEINFTAKANLILLQENGIPTGNGDSLAKGCFVCVSGSNIDSIMTHFEPNFARTCFPCFDDEKQRSNFEVSLSFNPKSISFPEICFFSNMPLEKKNSNGPNSQTLFFKKSPAIPTYLVCFGIGKFHKISTIENFGCKENNFDLSVFVHSSIFAMQTEVSSKKEKTPSILKLKEKPFIPLSEIIQILKFAVCFCVSYFEHDFFLPKLDIAIVPSLCLGGMENAGCIFIHKNVFFRSPGKVSQPSSSSKKEFKEESECISMILHEIVHQYIGNLLGMPFHLKEGLAQFFEAKMLQIYLDSFRNSSSFQFSNENDQEINIGNELAEANMSEIMDTMNSEIERKMMRKKNSENDNLKVNVSFLEEINEQKNSAIGPSFGLCFNGATYEQARQFVVERIEKIGERELQQRLRELSKNKSFQYIGSSWL